MLRKVRWFLLVAGLILWSGQAWAKSCKKELPPEIFKFFLESDLSAIECDDYFYRFIDLNEDKNDEIIVYKKQFSCSPKGFCDSEIFMKQQDKHINVGTLPGRYEVLKTKTGGFLDITVWAQNAQPVPYKWDGHQYKPEFYIKKGSDTATPTPGDPWNSLP